MSSLEKIFRALADAKARYLVVGGVAVIAHGHMRFTNDLDLVFKLSSEHLRNALEALQNLGFRPRIPVNLLDFADPTIRATWQDKKHMVVFSLFSPSDPDLIVDVFVTEPFDFDIEYSQAMWHPLSTDLSVPIVSLQRLMEMKRKAGRPHDLIDVEKLGTIRSIRDEDV